MTSPRSSLPFGEQISETIVEKKVDEKTLSKVGINELLRGI